MNVNECLSNKFKFQLYEYLVEKGFEHCVCDPFKLFNFDETSFKLNPSPGKVLAKRGARNVYNMAVNGEKDCYTALIGGKIKKNCFSFLFVISYLFAKFQKIYSQFKIRESLNALM